jgi:hypothetical protein
VRRVSRLPGLVLRLLSVMLRLLFVQSRLERIKSLGVNKEWEVWNEVVVTAFCYGNWRIAFYALLGVNEKKTKGGESPGSHRGVWAD